MIKCQDMPRKTRKHKLDASHRRVFLQPKHRDMVISEESVPAFTSPISYTVPDLETRQLPEESKQIIAPFLSHDLSKSLILAFAIISIQMGIYMAEKAGYIDITSLFTF